MDFYKAYFLLYGYSSKEISYLASMYFMHILKAKHIFPDHQWFFFYANC